jgi:zinc transporter ZupT
MNKQSPKQFILYATLTALASLVGTSIGWLVKDHNKQVQQSMQKKVDQLVQQGYESREKPDQ